MQNIKVTGSVKQFAMKGGWHYVEVPLTITEKIFGKNSKSFIPIIVKLNKTEWKTSLLPMGNGTYFIALKSEIRKKEKIKLNDNVTLIFSVIL